MRRRAALLLGPVVLAGVFSLARFGCEGGDIPADDEFGAARTALLDGGFDNDVDGVVFLPPWSLRPLVEMGDMRWLSGDDLHRRPLHRYRTLFAVVEPDSGKQMAALRNRLGSEEVVWSGDVLDVVKWTVGKSVVYDFREHLADAKVWLKNSDGSTTPCDRPIKTGFQCKGKKRWQRVGKERQLVSENGQQVIWAHPPPDSARLVVDFDDVPLAAGLIVRAGHTRKGADRAKAPVRLRVLVDGKEVWTKDKPPEFDYATWPIPLVDVPSGKHGKVRFEISTKNAGTNHFCFDAFTTDDVSGAQ